MHKNSSLTKGASCAKMALEVINMLYQPILKYSTPYYVGKTENFTSFPLHMHCEIEILYCQKGSLEATVNGRNFTVRAGEALLLESMADHALSSGKGGCSIMTVEYGPMLLKEKFAELSSLKFSAPVISLAEPKNIAIRDALCALSSLCGNNSPPAELCTVGELYKLSAALVSLYGESSSAAENAGKRRIGKALTLIYSNYQSAVTVDEAAFVSGYSKSHFCRNFKLVTGMSFHSYLESFRIASSSVLLRSTDYPVGKISESVGYNDTRSFCRAFKSIMGMTPMEYRKSET